MIYSVSKLPDRLIFAGLLVLSFILPSFAGSTDNINLDAAKVLQRASDYYQSAKTFSIKFTSKNYWASSDEWQKAKGRLWLGKADNFHVFLPGSELVSDGESYWKYSRANKQVVLSNAKESEAGGASARLLFSFLKCEPLELKMIKENGKNLFHLKLKPSGSLKNYEKVDVFLNQKDFAPYEIKTEDGAGNISVYTVTKLIRNKKFRKKDFVFKVPGGIELVDLRE